MDLVFDDMKKLKAMEDEFINLIKQSNIKLLRDLYITEDKYIEIRDMLRKVARRKEFVHYTKNYPVTISIFLVFCGVLYYKDGDLWEQVFSELNIKYDNKRRAALGDAFLYFINEYDLLSLDPNIGNKYVSSILMHGYISNYYSGKFFDRLNYLYEGVLEYNIDKSHIISNWDEMFGEEDDQDISNYKREGEVLKKDIEKLLEELKGYTIDAELQDMCKTKLTTLVENTELIEKQNTLDIKALDKLSQELAIIDENRNETNSIIQLANSIKSDTTISEAKELADYISRTFHEVNNDLNTKYTILSSNNKDLMQKIKMNKNEVTINQNKIRNIQTKIAILGAAIMEDGWDKLEEYTTLKNTIQEKNKELKKIERKINLKEHSLSTSFIQLYTAALYNLKITSPRIFEYFIISTFSMMDKYFRYNNINNAHILSSEFIKWYNSPQTTETRKKKPPYYGGGTTTVRQPEKSGDDETTIGYIKIANIKKPYYRLNLFKWELELVIPEQILKHNYIPEKEPEYIIRYKDNSNEIIKPSSKAYGDATLIHEMFLESDPTYIKDLMFKWFNKRELFNLEIDPVTIFDSDGYMLNETLVNNGTYYILSHESFELSEGDYIDKINTSIKGYKVYEISLNESSVTFINASTSEKIQFISSKYNHIHMQDLWILEGITIDNIEVLKNKYPRIKYNNQIIHDENMNIILEINEKVHLHKKLMEVAEPHIIEENIKIIDLNKLELDSYKYALRMRISIIDSNNNEIFFKEYYNLKGTILEFIEEGLLVNIPKNAKLSHPSSKREGSSYIIPLEKSPHEEIEIIYTELGWIKLMVEVPSISMRIIDEENKEVEINKNLLKSELLNFKDCNIVFQTKGTSIKFLHIMNENKDLDVIFPLKNNYLDIKIDSIIDLIMINGEKDTLSYSWKSLQRKTKIIDIFDIYAKWIVTDINVFPVELEDEFLIEVLFESNFNYENEKRIRMINRDKTIFDKSIEINNPIYYIKKDSLLDGNISIEIYYKQENSGSLFGRNKEIIAGNLKLLLKSRFLEIENIIRNGLNISAFKYNRDYHTLLNPFIIDDIEEAEASNFIGEKIYNGVATIKNKTTQVIFYIDIEKGELPLLLDSDGDGAQCDLSTGEVFWDIRRGKKIIAPVEYFKYKIREEE